MCPEQTLALPQHHCPDRSPKAASKASETASQPLIADLPCLTVQVIVPQPRSKPFCDPQICKYLPHTIGVARRV